MELMPTPNLDLNLLIKANFDAAVTSNFSAAAAVISNDKGETD